MIELVKDYWINEKELKSVEVYTGVDGMMCSICFVNGSTAEFPLENIDYDVLKDSMQYLTENDQDKTIPIRLNGHELANQIKRKERELGNEN